ncbi:MAG TPA: hypothetical protein VKV34_08120 [Thermoleophilia bacterium]|nr:hypothetical protein [Thermoleophilia bacterium]
MRRPTAPRLFRLLAASIAVELGVDLAVGVAADLAAPIVGDAAYVVAGVAIVGTLPLLVANVLRVVRNERRRQPQPG